MSIRDAHAMALIVVRRVVRSSSDPEISKIDPADLFVQGDREVQSLGWPHRRGVMVCVTDGVGWWPEVLVAPTPRGGVEVRFFGDCG